MTTKDGTDKERVMEKHNASFDYFDLTVEVSDEGNVEVEFAAVDRGAGRIRMDWDTLSEVIQFVGRHGLAMDDPMFVEYRDTREAIEKVRA